MSAEDEPQVRALVAESPEDSLAYFATRRDKSVVFAEKRPLRHHLPRGSSGSASPAATRSDRRTTGQVRSARGSSIARHLRLDTSGHRGQLKPVLPRMRGRPDCEVIRLGDEGDPRNQEFHLDGREMRPVRQAVQRLEQMGYRTRVRAACRHPGRRVPRADQQASTPGATPRPSAASPWPSADWAMQRTLTA